MSSPEPFKLAALDQEPSPSSQAMPQQGDALLLFQLGPVQEFIAQARSTRDLWSGSYLLSWLIAHGIESICDELKKGDEVIVFPALKGNGIISALRAKRRHSAQEHAWLLTPTLPNRFLAIVPADRAAELAAKAHKAISDELKRIAEAVWVWLGKQAEVKAWENRFFSQIESFLNFSWASQVWVNAHACQQELMLLHKKIPENLSSPDGLWLAHSTLVNAKLAARRNTRDFAAWGNEGKDILKGAIKDSLSGKEEVIGDDKFWDKLKAGRDKLFSGQNHRYGAVNLVKRLWCDAEVNYLSDELRASISRSLRFDTVADIACRNTDGIKGKDDDGSDLPKNGYVALLAMDGDKMGEWMSGGKIPATLSNHRAISAALANFSTWLAEPIVLAHKGQLIYSGGDDVLAMLPADQAIACAQALRAAFRAENPIQAPQPYDALPNMPAGTLTVLGPQSDVSIGIAIGHFRAPLQMLVKEAQAAEKLAKTRYNRGALAIKLYKRSGEITEWGLKWDLPSSSDPVTQSPGHALAFLQSLKGFYDAGLSQKFPYALARLLAPYKLDKALGIPSDKMQEILKREIAHVVKQQGSDLSKEKREALAKGCLAWLQQCSDAKDKDDKPAPRLGDFISLFLVETFMNRIHGEK